MAAGLSDEQIALRARARELAQRVFAPRAAEIDRSEQYPWANVEALVEAGFMGMTVPPELGGPGRSLLDVMLVIEEVSAACGVTGRVVVEGNMGALSAILQYGTEAQRQQVAELVLAGDKPAICITEPGAGSGASQLTTRADRRGDTYVINGTKHWITGGGVSQTHLIFARIFDEDGQEQGIGGFLAFRGRDEGLRVGHREPTMGLRGIPETEVIFEDLTLPADRLLPTPGGPRRGFASLMNAYNTQRVGAAAVALGLAEGSYRHALDFVQHREQFGRPICEFQGLQWKLADMSVQLEAARGMVWRAAATADPFPCSLAAAQAKIFTAEMAIRVTTDALQLHGARGYSRRWPLERLQRDARMFTIGGGTAEILRTVVASRILGRKLPQTRGGYARLAEREEQVAK